MTLEEQIQELKKTLTGNLIEDCETQSKIYNLKKQIAFEQGISIEVYESNNEDDCLNCGS